MNVDEEENQKKIRQDYAVRCGVLGIAGFILSVVFILLSLVVLVRFWIFDNIAYNIFVLSMLLIGILFNITSINLTFSEVTKSIYITPFMYGGLVAIFWNFIALLLPLLNHDYYSSFAHLPYANYDGNFYDGIANDSNQTTTMHSLAVRFLTVNSIFDNLPAILTVLICLAAVQIIFWIHAVILYCKVKHAENNSVKIGDGATKTL